ncbi:Major facilitator superfamily domain general substrate transporter [Penicillium cf. griseofulvum]|nr:Major facilitator superfamily domain general substrate transporter [Penicillium cf. griseofulvum]KAJ5449257.1 Major facilitator superfamily domain general substrate transporter [Penicillium cf. griseofulvum]
MNQVDDFQPGCRLPPGLFIFAWPIYRNIHWIASIIGSAVFGKILAYSGIFTFLVDVCPTIAVSAFAANSFTRSSFGGIFPLFGIPSKVFCPPCCDNNWVPVLCMKRIFSMRVDAFAPDPCHDPFPASVDFDLPDFLLRYGLPIYSPCILNLDQVTSNKKV